MEIININETVTATTEKPSVKSLAPNFNKKEHKLFEKLTTQALRDLDKSDLISLIEGYQGNDNFILMTDSYKLTHHLLYPAGLEELYSYMEPRGGDMPYTVFFGLQYYLKRYLSGVRVLASDVDEAHQKSIEHFGFDCFNRKMWDRVVNVHGGRIPIRICAVKEGSVVSTKNVLMTFQSTDPLCAPMTNVVETLFMKLWSPNTTAAYSRRIKEVLLNYVQQTSNAPLAVVDWMMHDFGARGSATEEAVRINAAAHLVNFKGSDSLSAIKFIQDYYSTTTMPSNSVIASEHAVVCAFGQENELEFYRNALQNVPTGILSLVSDTYSIYNVCRNILPSLKSEVLSRFNADGTPAKVVIRLDSGIPQEVMFGKPDSEDLDARLGVIKILLEQFGSFTNDKGFTGLNPHIGILQGDGVDYDLIVNICEKMVEHRYDVTMIVFGSGSNLLVHHRDDQKYAIKATYAKINGVGIEIQKNPVTDPGKKSKRGYLKLALEAGMYRTVEMGDAAYAQVEDQLTPVFENGELLVNYTFEQIREAAKI